MNPIEKLFRSRRFWTAVLNVGGIILVDALNMPEETAKAITDALLLLLAGYVVADTAAAYRTGEK